MDMIKEVKVNIFFFTMLKSNPKHSKMLKDFMAQTHIVGDIDWMEKVVMGGYCVAIIEGKLPPKMKDLSSFTLTYGVAFLMPVMVFMKLGPYCLKPTKRCLQMADRSFKIPLGTSWP